MRRYTPVRTTTTTTPNTHNQHPTPPRKRTKHTQHHHHHQSTDSQGTPVFARASLLSLADGRHGGRTCWRCEAAPGPAAAPCLPAPRAAHGAMELAAALHHSAQRVEGREIERSTRSTTAYGHRSDLSGDAAGASSGGCLAAGASSHGRLRGCRYAAAKVVTMASTAAQSASSSSSRLPRRRRSGGGWCKESLEQLRARVDAENAPRHGASSSTGKRRKRKKKRRRLP